MEPGATPQTRPRTVSRTHNPYAYPATPTGDTERGGSATTPVDPRLLSWNRADAPSPTARLGQSSSGTFVHPDVDCGRPRSVQHGRTSRQAERSPMLDQSAFPYQPQRELELKVGGEYVRKVVVSTPQPHDVAPIRLGSSRRGPATVGNRQGNTAPRPGSQSRPGTAGLAYPTPTGNMTPARRLDLAPTSPLVVGAASRRTPAVERVPSPPAFGSGTGSPTDVACTMPPPPAAMTPRTSPEAVFGPHVAKVVGEQPLSPPKSPRKAKEGMETLLRLYDQRPSMFAISAAIPADECIDRNPNTVAGRRRQVALGQMQPEYKRYLELVPRDRREARNMAHPVTPRPEYNFSCREFKKTVHAWRCALHVYGDPEATGNFEGGPSVYDPELYRQSTPPSGDVAAAAGTPLGVGLVDTNDDETTTILVQDVEDDARDTRRTPPTTPRHQVAHSTPSGRKGATPLHRPTPLKHGNTGGATAASTSATAAPLASSRQLFA